MALDNLKTEFSDSLGTYTLETVNFVLHHMLGIDELLLTHFFFKKKVIEQIESGDIKDSILHLITESSNEEHYLIPTGSHFEGFYLPHINVPKIMDFQKDIISYASKRDEDGCGYISDLDIMNVFKGIKIVEDVGEFQEEQMCCTFHPATSPGYVTLSPVTPLSSPWSNMTVEHISQLYLSGKKFLETFHERAHLICKEFSHQIYDINCHGPAFQVTRVAPSKPNLDRKLKDLLQKSVAGVDIVWALEISNWPHCAAEWVDRKRVWPPKGIVQSIVEAGCHIVPVPSKGAVAPVSDLEWRLSFSKAEKIMAKLLTNKQRKVYLLAKSLLYSHLKRYGVLSTYYLKTAIFWHCESEKNQLIWKECSLAHCFFHFFEFIQDLLKARNWPHYFLPDNNLIRSSDEQMVRKCLSCVSEIFEKPLTMLRECQNLLVANAVHTEQRSFDEIFMAILKQISKTTSSNVLDSAYFDVLWDLGHFDLLAIGIQKALVYFKKAKEFSRKLSIVKHMETLNTILEFAQFDGDLDCGIECGEEMMELLQTDNFHSRYRKELDEQMNETCLLSEDKESRQLNKKENKYFLNDEKEVENESVDLSEDTTNCCQDEPIKKDEVLNTLGDLYFSKSEELKNAILNDLKLTTEHQNNLLETHECVPPLPMIVQSFKESDKPQCCKTKICKENEISKQWLEVRKLRLKAEEYLQSAVGCASSIVPFTALGNFLLHTERPQESIGILEKGIKIADEIRDTTIVYFKEYERCTLDCGLRNIVDNEGEVVYLARIYCRYLLFKGYFVLKDKENYEGQLKLLDNEAHKVTNETVREGGLLLLKQSFRLCNLTKEMEDVQAELDAAEEDGSSCEDDIHILSPEELVYNQDNIDMGEKFRLVHTFALFCPPSDDKKTEN